MSNDTNTNGTQDDNFANFGIPGGDDGAQQASPATQSSNDEGSLDENVPSVKLDTDEKVESGTDSANLAGGKPADLDAQMASLSGLGTPTTPPEAENKPQEVELEEKNNEAEPEPEAPPVLGEGEVKTESDESTSPLAALANRLSSIKGGLVEETVDTSEDDMSEKVEDSATVDPVSVADTPIDKDTQTEPTVTVDTNAAVDTPDIATTDSMESNDEPPPPPDNIDINAPTPLTDQLVSDAPVPEQPEAGNEEQTIVQIDPDLNDPGGKEMNAPVTDTVEETDISDEIINDSQNPTDTVAVEIPETTEVAEESSTVESDVNIDSEPTPVVEETLPDSPASSEPVLPAEDPTPVEEVIPVTDTAFTPPVSQVAIEADEVDPLVGGEDIPKVAHTRYPYTIEQLLDIVVEKDASDLHVTVGYPAMIRVDGSLLNVLEELVTEKQAMDLIFPVLPEQKKELLDVNREVDLAYPHREDARFRINAYYQKQTLAGAFRLIPNRIRSIDELNLPQIYHQLTKLKQGLVLVTGPTGSGKSTTLAAILQEINESRPDHIITIEDPVEYILPRARAMVDQRELHEDTHSWEIAMRSALRQDPDVILVGEMRDYETISAAITLAETGHLVFATLHTNSAAQTLDRIVDVFPEHQQAQVRSQLSNTIEAVVAQRLMPINRGGRVAVSEIMIATPAIRNLIREAKTHQIDNVIRTSADIGMISLEHTLVKMVRDNTITMERAQEYAVHPEEVVRLLKS